MAGFFGLFDYSKPGPGVDKNAPKKKGFFEFWDIYFRKFWRLVQANLLYMLVSLPIVTNGLAEAGLTYITRNFSREKHAFVSGDFFGTIKKNWKQALPIGLINLLLTFLLVYDIFFFYSTTANEDGSINVMGYILFILIMGVGVVFTFMKYYFSVMIITFKMTWKQIYRNCLILAFAGLWRNLLISAILVLVYAIGFVIAWFVPSVVAIPILIFAAVFFFPAFRSMVIQYNIFPVIKKHLIDPYYAEHPGEDKEARKNLNLETEPEPVQEDDEPIFTDVGRNEKEEAEEKAPLRIPKQYSEREIRKAKRFTKSSPQGRDDDDDTI